jgi:hypothetical protein
VSTQLRPEPASAYLYLSDAGFTTELAAARAAGRPGLEQLAETGRLFLMTSDDPVYFHVDLYVDEPVPDEVDRLFTGRSGAHLLRAPTGRLVVSLPADNTLRDPAPDSFAQTVEIPVGDYAVSVRDRAVADVQAHDRQLREAIGQDDWRFYNRVNWTGALGCPTLGFAVLLALVPFIRHELWPLLLLGAVPLASFGLMSLLPRYRRVRTVERRLESSLPTFVVSLSRLASTDGLSGGWFRY